MQLTVSKFFKRRTVAIAAASILGMGSLNAYAVDPFTLENIRVDGLHHADAGTVFASLPFRIGDTYDDEQGRRAIQLLYATGLFSDVKLQTEDGVLVILVEERPTIASLTFTGSKVIGAEALKTALRSVGIAEGRPYDKALADQAEQEIKRQYLSQGYYSSSVEIVSIAVENNKTNLSFDITEGKVAKINEIRLIGNKEFSTSKLRKQLDLSEGGWFSWYTKSNRYSREKLNADLEILRSYYLNRGYLDFQINSTQVEITPDKTKIAIIVDLTEGPKYMLSEIDIQGDYLGREEEFRKIVNLKVGKPYDASAVAALVKSFTDKFGEYGYAFAQVQTQPDVDREQGTVKVSLISRPQRRVYVRHVNIRGNDRTRDEVVRREFRQLESAWYDWKKIQLSRDRVDRLGYFTEVDINTAPIPDTDDQVDVTMDVKEKPTGNLVLGAGVSSDDKFSVNFGISQENIFGTGNYLGFNANTSKYNKQFNLSSSNPYFTQDGVSRSFDFYYSTSRPYSSENKDQYYSIEMGGGSMNFGIPFSEIDRVYFGIGAEMTKINPGRELPGYYEKYINKYGEKFTYIPLTVGWKRDGRDSALVPSRGNYQRLNGELSLLGDTHYFKGNYQFQHWVSFGDFTLGGNAEVGYGKGLGNKDFPVFKNFFGGGQNFVRGFKSGTFGDYDWYTDTYSGGTHSYNLNVELYMPLPGTGKDRTLRASTFLDYGNVTTEGEGWKFDKARISYGVGFSWISPLGPLKFSYAIPIQKESDDDVERFQFNIGTSF